MSSRLVDIVFDLPGIKVGQLTVLMSICRHAHSRKNDCCMSRDVIAAESHLTARQVTRIMPTLVKAGYIIVVSGKGRASSMYTVQVDFIKSEIAKDRIKARQLSKNRGETASLRRDIGTRLEDRQIVTYSPFDVHFSESLNTSNEFADAGRVVKKPGQASPRTSNLISAHMAAKRDARILIARLEELSPREFGGRVSAKPRAVEEQVPTDSGYSARIRWPVVAGDLIAQEAKDGLPYILKQSNYRFGEHKSVSRQR
jgi:hypothetical protein